MSSPEEPVAPIEPEPGRLAIFIFENRLVWLLAIVLVGVVADQASKIWAQNALPVERTLLRENIEDPSISRQGDGLEPLELEFSALPGSLRASWEKDTATQGDCRVNRMPLLRDAGGDGFRYDEATRTLTVEGGCIPSASSARLNVQYRYQKKQFVHRNTIVVIPHFFNFKYAENPAAAFSLTGSIPTWLRRPLLVGVSSLAMIFIGIWYFRLRRPDGVLMSAFSLIIAGAIGNFIDRVRLGYVIDFLDVYAGFINSTWPHWPTFNIADSCIVVGALSVVYRTLRPLYPEDEEEEEEPKDKSAPT